jgi:hypothetical protein
VQYFATSLVIFQCIYIAVVAYFYEKEDETQEQMREKFIYVSTVLTPPYMAYMFLYSTTIIQMYISSIVFVISNFILVLKAR